MAKVTAPLFSFAASGQLAKVLVYSRWKGIKDVRSYAIPANPNSAAQQQQRSYFDEAVLAWHNADLTPDDYASWNRYAATLPSPQSGFNAAVSVGIFSRRAGFGDPQLPQDGTGTDNGGGSFDMEITTNGVSGADGGYFKWGYSPTSLINTVTGVYALAVLTAAAVPGVAGTRVYWRPFITDGGIDVIAGGLYVLDLAP